LIFQFIVVQDKSFLPSISPAFKRNQEIRIFDFFVIINLAFIALIHSLTCHCRCRILLYFFEKRMPIKSINSNNTIAVIIICKLDYCSVNGKCTLIFDDLTILLLNFLIFELIFVIYWVKSNRQNRSVCPYFE
jgi:hypothetical protein